MTSRTQSQPQPGWITMRAVGRGADVQRICGEDTGDTTADTWLGRDGNGSAKFGTNGCGGPLAPMVALYRRRRREYIWANGLDAYNRDFLFPHHDYRYFEHRPWERVSAIVAYDPYPIHQLPYRITDTGHVFD